MAPDALPYASSAPIPSESAAMSNAKNTLTTPLSFHLGAFGLFLPALLFSAASIVLFACQRVFDLSALAAAAFVSLALGALLCKTPTRYWEAAVRSAASPLTASVLMLLLAGGVFSALMKASGLAAALAGLAGGFFTGSGIVLAGIFLTCALLATATGSSISTILTAAPVFLPAAAALGVDPSAASGAILSGAIFGDNLSPVSDVAIISAMTQTESDGSPAELGAVVASRAPLALAALIVALPLFLLHDGELSAEAAASEFDAASLLMLIPVALLILLAVRTRNALFAMTAASLAAAAIGLASGIYTPQDLFRTSNSGAEGALVDGIRSVSGLMLMLLSLLSLTGILEASNLAEAFAEKLKRTSGGSLASETLIAAASLLFTALFAAVTSVSAAAAGTLSNRLCRQSVDACRRANLVAGFANSLPVLLPFSAFMLITASAAEAALGAGSVQGVEIAKSAYYPAALFLVLTASIVCRAIRSRRSALASELHPTETSHA